MFCFSVWNDYISRQHACSHVITETGPTTVQQQPIEPCFTSSVRASVTGWVTGKTRLLVFLQWHEGGRLIHVPLPLECLLWNKGAAAHHRLAFTFQSTPTRSLQRPHPCNHVSSYIIAFQLLTGVWPLPPNMPNLIHVFPKRQRDALFLGRRPEKKETCINMQCHAKAIKRDSFSFLLIQPGTSAAIFSRTYNGERRLEAT